MAWHYVNENREQTEVPGDDLAALVEAGSITRDTLIWQDGMPDWIPAAQAQPELFGETAEAGAEAAAATTTPVAYEAPAASAAYTGAGTDYRPEPPTSRLAIGSLVCGILSLIACGALSGIPGAVCGHMALNQMRMSNGAIGGRGMAITGLVLSYIAIGLTVIAIIIYLMFGLAFFGAAAAASSTTLPAP